MVKRTASYKEIKVKFFHENDRNQMFNLVQKEH